MADMRRACFRSPSTGRCTRSVRRSSGAVGPGAASLMTTTTTASGASVSVTIRTNHRQSVFIDPLIKRQDNVKV